jgi:acyl carrier protein
VVTALTIEPDGDIPELPSIGKPVINTRIYILDKWRHLAPLGVVGEIWIGGVQVGRGYLNRPELTAEKFYKAYRTHKTYINYRTGDLGRWLPDGNIEFLGRIDQQVKIRGFRIELGEIENSLLKINGIKEAVVIAREDETRDKYLCAYIVSKKEVIVTELSGYLSANLPDYMIPSYFVRLEKIPLTPNGKIDRKALPKTWLIAGENYTAPRNEIETKLVELWAEILSKDQAHASHLQTSIGIDDNFFQLGGHSLKATIVMSKIHKEIGVKMDLVQLFKNPTIREIASLIKTIRCASQSLSETNIDEEIIEVKL